MKFIDEVEIDVAGGDGGNGCVAFRRERYRPKGGPAGGNGGRGGSIVLEATERMASLLDLRYHPHWKAEKGRNGQGSDRHCRSGKDVILHVPCGTVITDADTGDQLADLDLHGKTAVAARGGRGGRGNLRFKSATRQTPDIAEPGGEGEKRRLKLELKLIADVGVLGFPNLGKSTLVRRVSAARPRVADYPFTTLVPSPGVVRLDDVREFVIADMPGLVEGASNGVGLGIRFLKHVERTRVLCHLVTVGREPGSDPVRDYRIINDELAGFSSALADRPQVVAVNKVDLGDVREALPETCRRLEEAGAQRVLAVSAATGEGVTELLEELWSVLSDTGDG
ncbi:MAG: GTPase ObgE [Deltaproteobacteria bacterium]|nr:GTPase ObgE [Deltaproteobacteria bacterium]